MDDRLAKLLLEDNILSIQKRDSARISLLEKLATIKSVDLQTLPIPGTTNPPLAVDPGGWDKSVQYNDNGLFGGDANLIWDKTTQALTIKANSGTSTLLGVSDGSSTGLNLSGGNATGTDVEGGVMQIYGGKASGDAPGGAVYIWAGDAVGIGGGGKVEIKSGVGGATSGDGGEILLTAGNADVSGNGGSIALTPGLGAGAGVDGIVGVNSDLHILGTGATGIVLYDTTLAGYYRITLDNGVLIITAV
jgi:hypothetical protein